LGAFDYASFVPVSVYVKGSEKRKMNRTLTLASLLVVSLLVLAPSVHASSVKKILTINVKVQFWGVVDGAFASYGVAWGDFTGWIFATTVLYKVSEEGNWFTHCTEYWFEEDPTSFWGAGLEDLRGLGLEDLSEELKAHATMISALHGKGEWVSDTTAYMVYNGQVKYATEPYSELVGRNVHLKGTFTWDPELVYVIEATLWLSPNK
jgi:hypothetical protein